MDVADAPVSRTDQGRFISAASDTTRTFGRLGSEGDRPAAVWARATADSRSSVPNSTISHALPSGNSAMTASASPRSRKPPTMPVSSPSIAIGSSGSSWGTQSAASKMVGNPNTVRTRDVGLRTKVVVARNTETHVPSEPTSARAMLKPFSGSNWSRLYPETLRLSLGKPARISSA